MLATIGFIACFVIFPIEKIVYIWPIGKVSALNFSLGLTLAVALFCIGAGASTGRAPDVGRGDRRRPAPDLGRARGQGQGPERLQAGAEDSVLGRRKLIRNTMFGALAMVPLSGIVLLRDLGPLPEDKLRHTLWGKGKALVNMNTGEPLRPEDIAVGSLTFAKPEGLEEHDHGFMNEIAKAALMIVRLQPEDIKDKRELDWSHEGIVAFSKICTHVAAPSASTSSRRTTRSARATSPPSTSPTVPG